MMNRSTLLPARQGIRPFGHILPLLLVLAILAACGAPAPGASSPAAEVSSAASTEAAASAEPAASAASAEPAASEAASAEPAASEAASAAGSAETTASPEETLIFAADLSDQISMDPAYVYEFGGIQVIGNIYETLVSFDPGDPTIKPLLAKEWNIEQTADGSTITFTLDENASFASGNPVTAEDVVWSWSRALDLNQSPAFLFVDIAQLTKENMRAVDDQTLEVKLPNTASPQVFLSILSFTLAAVLDSKLVQENLGSDNGHAWLDDNSAGSGPYVLERWDRNAQNTLAVNPNFWREAPAIKRVIMRNVGELANLQSALETGEADIVQDLGAEQIAVLEGNPDLEIVKASSTLLVYLGMNATKAPLTTPTCVRRSATRSTTMRSSPTCWAATRSWSRRSSPRACSGTPAKSRLPRISPRLRSCLQQPAWPKAPRSSLRSLPRKRRAASNGAPSPPKSRPMSSRSGSS